MLSIMTHWHDTLVISSHRLSQSHTSHVDAKVSQQDDTHYGCLERLTHTTDDTYTDVFQVLLCVSLKNSFTTHRAAVRMVTTARISTHILILYVYVVAYWLPV